ncbi:MAG: hypothetical protein WC581_05875 [Thermodesulfovibrionales bacterium]
MINLFCLDYNEKGEPIIQIEVGQKKLFLQYFDNLDVVKEYAQKYKVYWLYLKEGEMYVHGEPALGDCDAYPRSTGVNNSHNEICQYKVTLRSDIDLEMKQKEIAKIKSEFGVEVNENEFYYWLFFHELGHTYEANKDYHAGALVPDKNEEELKAKQEFKIKQEELAKKYCLKLYMEWKSKLNKGNIY